MKIERDLQINAEPEEVMALVRNYHAEMGRLGVCAAEPVPGAD
jgi:hypothetical protein